MYNGVNKWRVVDKSLNSHKLTGRGVSSLPTGAFQHNIDSKGRLFIPAKLRAGLGDRFVVAKSMDQQPCLCLFTMEEWLELDEKINKLPLVKANRVLRYKYDKAAEVECDPQGRITLTSLQREHADLSETAYITGVSRHVEIWNKPGLGVAEDGPNEGESLLDLMSEVI